MTNLIPARSIFSRLVSPNTFICRACLARARLPRQSPWPPALTSAQYSTEAALRSESPTTTTPSPSDLKPRQGRRLPKTQALRRQLRKTRDAQKPGRFLSHEEMTSGSPDYTVRFFEQNEQGQMRQLDDQDAFNDSFNNLPPFPDIGEWFENLKSDQEMSPFQDVIQAFQDGVMDQLKDVSDPQEKQSKLEAYMRALQERMGEPVDEEEAAELDELKRELDSPSFLDGIDDMPDDDLSPRMRRKMKRRSEGQEAREAGEMEMAKEEEDEEELTDEDRERTLSTEIKRRRKLRAPQIPENREVWEWPTWHKIARLNKALENRVSVVDRGRVLAPKLVGHTWKLYYAVRLALVQNYKYVPEAVWSLLWDMISSSEDASSPYRLPHLARLAQDMIRADVVMSPEQQLLAIEAVFVAAVREDGLEMFRKAVTTLGAPDAHSFKDFWELGVRLYCALGDTDRAERAVAKLLDRQFDARILQPIIRAHAAKGNEEGDETAWRMYHEMRDRLGASMKLEDYDEVIATFLASQQMERAFQAFVDMMTEGTVDLMSQGQKMPLPPLLRNKFFFGKWVKRLVLTDNLDGAHAVLRFMGNFKIRAAPIAANTLIGSWLRIGGEENFEKADSVAWEMIRSRMNFVELRAQQLDGKKDNSADDAADANAAPPLSGPVRLVETVLDPEQDTWALPPANAETFMLLAESYRARGMHPRVIGLWEAMVKCEIMPDTRLMNKLINSYQCEDQTDEGRELYSILVGRYGVPPDAHTFDSLWWMLDINRCRVLSDPARLADIPNARALFAEVLRHEKHLGPEIHPGLARIMLHTLRRLGDGAGAVVALRALRKIFNFIPSDMLAVELHLGVLGLTLETPEGRNRIRGGLRDLVQQVRHMRARARHRAKEAGLARSELDDKPAGDLIATYLEAKLLPRSVTEEEFWAAVDEMGTGPLLRGEKGVAVQPGEGAQVGLETPFGVLEQTAAREEEVSEAAMPQGEQGGRPEVDKIKEHMFPHLSS